jgi:hypothetical protein
VSIKCWVTSSVIEVMSWAFQGQHHSRREKPLGSRPTRLSLVEHPPLSLVQASDMCLPLAGVSTFVWWDFIPMEVQTNHLPMCTCPSGVALQQHKVRPPWDHKSQGSWQCQSRIIIKLSKHVLKTLVFPDKCSKTLCYSTS